MSVKLSTQQMLAAARAKKQQLQQQQQLTKSTDVHSSAASSLRSAAAGTSAAVVPASKVTVEQEQVQRQRELEEYLKLGLDECSDASLPSAATTAAATAATATSTATDSSADSTAARCASESSPATTTEISDSSSASTHVSPITSSYIAATDYHCDDCALDLSRYLVSRSSFPSAYVLPSFISAAEEQRMLSLVAAAPAHKWTTLKRRRLQQWGGVPSADPQWTAEPLPQWQQQIIDRIDRLQIFPSQQEMDQLQEGAQQRTAQADKPQAAADSTHPSAVVSPSSAATAAVASSPRRSLRPNHVLLNEYRPGEGILPHVDGPLYVPLVCILSLGSHTVFTFFRELKDSLEETYKPAFRLYLPPRSLFIFTHQLYTHMYHSIEERCSDDLTGVLNVPNELQGKTVERGTRVSLTIRKVATRIVAADSTLSKRIA